MSLFFGRCLCPACSREIHQSLTDPELPAERIRDLCRHQGWEEGESTGVEHDRRGAHWIRWSRVGRVSSLWANVDPIWVAQVGSAKETSTQCRGCTTLEWWKVQWVDIWKSFSIIYLVVATLLFENMISWYDKTTSWAYFCCSEFDAECLDCSKTWQRGLCRT